MKTHDVSAWVSRYAKPLGWFIALAGLTQLAMDPRGCHDGSASGGEAGSAGTGQGPGQGCVVDGKHYAVGEGFPSSDGCNQCNCSADGLAGCTQRACLAFCGGLTGAACPTDQYCNYPAEALCGAADATGTCAPKPEGCTQEYNPVCGCDAQTYGNTCTAAAAGVSVVQPGECAGASTGGSGGAAGSGGVGGSSGSAGSGGTAGGRACTTDAQCPQPPCACIDSNADGTCDNQCPTFGCRDGQCVDVSQPKVCGGLLGRGCADSEFCNFPPDARCGAADATGVCEAKPEICNFIFAPVCGCDGNTYSNACGSKSAGVSVAASGECASEPPKTLGVGDSCGGFEPADAPKCAAGLLCQFQPGALCGAADAPGKCVEVPGVCSALYAPVCSCDGVTYSSACVATRAGAGISALGACQ